MTVVLSVAITLLAFEGFRWTAIYRFHDPGLNARMTVYAKLLQLENLATVPQDLQELNDANHFQFHFESKAAVVAATEKLLASRKEPSLISVHEALAQLKVVLPFWGPDRSSPIFTPKFTEDHEKAWRALGIPDAQIAKVKAAVKPLGFAPNFREDRVARAGIDPANARIDPAKVSANAREYLSMYPVFSDFATLRRYGDLMSFETLAKPWNLFRFYDSRRADLNENIPLALGVILLATGLLLDFRLIDYDKRKRNALTVYAPQDGVKWIPVWLSTTAGEKPRIVAHPRLMIYAFGGCLLTMYIEFFLNKPLTRMEWLVNVPIMVLVGILLPIIWTTLAEIGDSRVRFNPDLKHYSPEDRKTLLKPFILGTVSMLFVAIWLFIDSVFVLLGTRPDRAVIQILVCVTSFFLLWRMWRRVKRDFDAIPTEDEEPVPRGVVNTLSENIVRSVLLALLPAKMVLDVLLKG